MTRGQLKAVPGSLSLTFDDGPDRVWTRRVMAALDRHDAKGTFFIVGERLLAEPIVACEALEQGHEVQLHCHRHIRHTEFSESEIERDAWDALAALAEIGVEPTRWRTPWGVATADSRTVAARLGLRLTGWDHDTHDWRGDSPAVMTAALRPRLSLGGSVLMHDAERWLEHRGPARSTDRCGGKDGAGRRCSSRTGRCCRAGQPGRPRRGTAVGEALS
jgi:peptidoglycan/xylan/chitin deacetylase (PgdA/CDA1 family)